MERKYKIKIYPLAQQDMDEIFNYISNEYVKDQSLRKIIVNNYIAFYRIKDDEIQIVRVLYAMSNYQELL